MQKNKKIERLVPMKKTSTQLFLYFFIMISSSFFIALFAFLWKEKTLIASSYPSFVTTGRTHVLTTGFEEKIWVHRVNSTQRAGIMQNKYTGMEMDVIYDEENSRYYVSHDPVPEQYIQLDEILHTIQNPQNHLFWLDFKNLSENNCRDALNSLLELTQKYNLNTNNIIVESPNPYYLSDFTDSGFRTSYYIPRFNPYRSSQDFMLNKIQKIDSVLSISNVNYLSGEHNLYQFLKFYYPESKILLWYLPENILSPYVRRKLNHDSTVDVILIPEASEGYL